jgi:hypothetical protein
MTLYRNICNLIESALEVLATTVFAQSLSVSTWAPLGMQLGSERFSPGI